MYAKEYYAKLEMAKQKQESLTHHGIIGQKWGVRRFQYADGSYTDAGRERYGIGKPRNTSGGLKDEDIEKFGSELIALTVAAGIAGVNVGTKALHDAIISKQIKAYEEHRKTEEIDPKTKLRIKSDPDATIKEDMKFINREIKYSLFGDDFGSTENCMLCTTALDIKRRGYDVKAGKVAEGFYAKDIHNWYKGKNELTLGKYNEVITKLTQEPEGSYGNLMVYWKEGGGHSMFYRIEDGEVMVYDAQSNKRRPLNQITKHANVMIPGTCYIRTDNMEPDYTYLRAKGLIT